MAERDAKGRFVKGVSGNPRGKTPLPPEFKNFAAQAPSKLMKIADDPKTPANVKVNILQWFTEMYHGKAPQFVDVEGSMENKGTTVIKFEGELEKWVK